MELVRRWACMPLLFFAVSISLQVFAYDTIMEFEKNKSKFKVLVFLSRSCPCSRSHVEHLNELDQKYEAVSFFGIITDIFDKDSEKEINQYYAEKNFKFPLIKDEAQLLIKKYRALKTPHSVLLKRNDVGEYKVTYEGGVTNRRDFASSTQKFLSENLEAIIHNKPLVYTSGKSLGCYIRRL